ncbi:hypothetical protein AVEN_86255-1 [Araneus ventricosus]|uniref:Uncharacterized protein n=1 Tax=Araneus ventricosus TaxID=182803 RepID=A0A4Y2RNQ8_ARAVE|nr:hypothetical protein AVEN_86255-1 [Araneus ventricosus]
MLGKKTGKIKSINDMTPHKHRKVRKNWQEESKKSYDFKKIENELEIKLEQDTPPANCPYLDSPVLVQNVPSTSRANMFKNRRRKNRQELKKEIEHLKSQFKEANKKKEKYKRAQRSQIAKLDTPAKNLKELTKGLHIAPAVKRKLLYGDVLTKQLRENFKNKTKYRKVIAGKVVKKYRLMSEVGKLCSVKMIRSATTEKKNKCNKLHRFLTTKNRDRKFLERDEHSRMCPGKQDPVTYKKNKRQTT